MNKSYLQKGFTLIELLVVIAIIGILSSVVLASLSTARSKGNDGKVQAQMGGIRSQAEILYSDTGSAYGTAQSNVDCSNAVAGSLAANANFVTLKNAMPTGTLMKCGTTATSFAAYAVAASLSGGAAGDYWCVDSTGFANKINIATPANVLIGEATCALMDAK